VTRRKGIINGKKCYNKRLHKNFNHFIPQITTLFVWKHAHYHKSNAKLGIPKLWNFTFNFKG
jgi:hypothetical protein